MCHCFLLSRRYSALRSLKCLLLFLRSVMALNWNYKHSQASSEFRRSFHFCVVVDNILYFNFFLEKSSLLKTVFSQDEHNRRYSRQCKHRLHHWLWWTDDLQHPREDQNGNSISVQVESSRQEIHGKRPGVSRNGLDSALLFMCKIAFVILMLFGSHLFA